MYILLAEDDLRLGKLIVHMLKKELHSVDWVKDGMDAYHHALSSDYDMIILDWMMPKLDGVQVCKQLRECNYQGPILMLTAKDALSDRVCGLDSGADDYLVKPFAFEELFARLRALFRRGHSLVHKDIIQVGDLALDLTSHSVTYSGEPIYLTPREFQLLELFMRNKGQVLTRELILDRVWGYDSEVSNNTLDAYIKLLRKKLERETPLIHNIRGVGYKLETTDV